MWQGQCQMPLGDTVQYKYVRLNKNKEVVEWMHDHDGGENLELDVANDLRVVDNWDGHLSAMVGDTPVQLRTPSGPDVVTVDWTEGEILEESMKVDSCFYPNHISTIMNNEFHLQGR